MRTKLVYGSPIPHGSFRHFFLRRAHAMNTKASRRRVPGRVSRIDLIKLVLKYNNRCYYCTVDMYIGSMEDAIAKNKKDILLTFDHKIPVSRGGLNVIENIVPSCYLCNYLKDSYI